MTMKDDLASPENPPAFPVTVKRNTSSDPLATPRELQFEGMTLRDWFAGQALIGLIHPGWDADTMAAPTAAYRIADAMLRARQSQGEDHHARD